MKGYRKSPPETPLWVYAVGVVVLLVLAYALFR